MIITLLGWMSKIYHLISSSQVHCVERLGDRELPRAAQYIQGQISRYLLSIVTHRRKSWGSSANNCRGRTREGDAYLCGESAIAEMNLELELQLALWPTNSRADCIRNSILFATLWVEEARTLEIDLGKQAAFPLRNQTCIKLYPAQSVQHRLSLVNVSSTPT